MKKNIEEMVLLYNFTDEDQYQAIKSLLKQMKIKVLETQKTDYAQNVGFLFGIRGFGGVKIDEASLAPFDFPHELMMFHNFSRERLGKVLQSMRDNNITVPICKSMVTKFNRFWTIRRVCETMQKEHLAMTAQNVQQK